MYIPQNATESQINYAPATPRIRGVAGAVGFTLHQGKYKNAQKILSVLSRQFAAEIYLPYEGARKISRPKKKFFEKILTGG